MISMEAQREEGMSFEGLCVKVDCTWFVKEKKSSMMFFKNLRGNEG
jgi:hypothetical protein